MSNSSLHSISRSHLFNSNQTFSSKLKNLRKYPASYLWEKAWDQKERQGREFLSRKKSRFKIKRETVKSRESNLNSLNATKRANEFVKLIRG